MAGSAAEPAAPQPISSQPPNYHEDFRTAEDPFGHLGVVEGFGARGSRWSRQETLALLKIRSDMDATFRDATLKGPLWEDVSRKLAELGYRRSAKKCKEKFENVHKYYKRTKEGRASRQDGKSYHFFNQLEALHRTAATSASTSVSLNALSPQQQIPAPTPIASAPPPLQQPMSMQRNEPLDVGAGISLSSNSTSTDTSGLVGNEEDDDDVATEEGPSSRKKRKREGGRKMMGFIEGLMRQVMERQEEMQQRFLEEIEKREQDQTIRDEAWRRQETERLAREHELAAGERAAAATRGAAVISFLQKLTGQTVLIPPHPPPSPNTVSIVDISQPQQHQTPTAAAPRPLQQRNVDLVRQTEQRTPKPMQPTPSELGPSELHDGGGSLDPASSRWPKLEVHALIKLRSELDARYQESGPKGPMWEEISVGMKRLGYNRSSKRCKEKWENINKYFKKVKENNKKRPEDAKTCPYFHQLDALYRSKILGHDVSALTPNPNPISVMPPPPLQPQKQPPINQGEMHVKKDNGASIDTLFGDGNNTAGNYGNTSGILKKPVDIVKELMDQSSNINFDEPGSDIDEDDIFGDRDEDEEEDGNGRYRIQFQRQNFGGSSASAPPSAGGKTSAGSFLTMVK